METLLQCRHNQFHTGPERPLDHDGVAGADRRDHLRLKCGRVPMQRLTRPHDPDRFAEVTALVAQQIKQEAQE